MTHHFLCFSLLFSFFATAQDRVIITGLLDGTADGAKPRVVELYVEGTVDLAGYELQRYANGNPNPTGTDLSGTYTDAFVYLVNGVTEFETAFGTAGDFANVIETGLVTGNGNDAFALDLNGAIVDVVGGPIGGPEASIYADSYLYRRSDTGPDGEWAPENWTVPGEDLLDDRPLTEYASLVPFGTYTSGPPRPRVEAYVDGPAYEDAFDSVTPISVTLEVPANTTVTVTYRLTGTATGGVDYEHPGNDTVVFPAGVTDRTVDIFPLDDALIEGTETIVLELLTVSDPAYDLGPPATLELLDDDLGDQIIGIHTVQGSGELSPLAGNVVTVQGIVTGDFTDGLGGFFLQEEETDYDRDTTTSEGLFVYAPDAEVAVGDLVTVRAPVEEFFRQTQLDGAAAGAGITVDSSGLGLPTAVVLTLPRADSALEMLEGMLVRSNDLVVTSVNNLVRFGEVEVAYGERLVQFTECNDPDPAAYAAYLDGAEQRTLIVDDGRSGTNLQPIRLPDGTTLSATNTVRGGQRLSRLTGALGYGFDRYRIQPTDPARTVLVGNERPVAAPDFPGSITVASVNVLNYFTTLGSRGADTEAELLRQEAKIVAALTELDADIVGLIEIENNDNAALRRLVDTLNRYSPRGYACVDNPNPGDDEITVALIYDTLRMEETGTAATLATPDSLFVGPSTNRVPLAQTFHHHASENLDIREEFTVVVNHFKSKAGGCGPGDDDPGGAGNCNGTRTAAARAIVDWLATYPTGVENDDVLVIGDLNSYRMEDPIRVFLEAGYTDTKTLFNDKFPCGGGPPSYSFDGFWGSLDYALASPSLSHHAFDATAWPVNAPEPSILDYNTEGGSDSLYAPDFYRFSDHDPIIVPIFYGVVLDATVSPAGGEDALRMERMGTHRYGFRGPGLPGNFLLSNAAGQVLRAGKVAEGIPSVDVSGLPTGVYFILLRGNGAEAAFKIAVP